MSSRLDSDVFKQVVRSAPLVSIDLVVKNAQNQILLGKRINRPAKGFWFVPGGRIYKDESLARAFERLTLTELGVELKISNATYVGLYEHFYPDSVFCDSKHALSTHYVVNCFEVSMPEGHKSPPYEQHNEYCWLSESELLANTEVHEHTRWYFEKEKGFI